MNHVPCDLTFFLMSPFVVEQDADMPLFLLAPPLLLVGLVTRSALWSMLVGFKRLSKSQCAHYEVYVCCGAAGAAVCRLCSVKTPQPCLSASEALLLRLGFRLGGKLGP